MTQDRQTTRREIPRRALVSHLSTNALLLAGGTSLISKVAGAGQTCTSGVQPGQRGRMVVPRPAGGGRYVIDTDCMPNHAVGPYFASNLAPKPVAMRFYFAADPKAEASPTAVGERIFGVGVNGTPFESVPPAHGMAEPWQYNVLSPELRAYFGFDANNGHTYSNGQYHYVGSPTGLLCGLLDARQSSPGAPTPLLLLGWAADGFPIYADLAPGPLVDGDTPLAHTLFRSSYRLRSGVRPADSPGGVFDGTFVQDYEFVQGSGDLDECNGRFGATAEYPSGTYYYVITKQFPYLPLAFRGRPDASFETRSGAMPLPKRLGSYTGKPYAAGSVVPENPESDAALLGLPAGLASAQQPLVMDSNGYRYFLSICSLDGKLYHSATAIASCQVVSPWQKVPNQASFASNRPDLAMLSSDRFRVSVQDALTKMPVSAQGSLERGTIHFEPWRPTP